MENQINILEKKNAELIECSTKKIKELTEEIDKLKNNQTDIQLYRAIANVQRNLSIVKKGLGQSGSFKFKYFELEDILEVLEPLLLKNGLMIIQAPVEQFIETQIIHLETGQKTKIYKTKIVPCINSDPSKAHGGGITYAQRYTLKSLFGIVEDNDPDKEFKKTK